LFSEEVKKEKIDPTHEKISKMAVEMNKMAMEMRRMSNVLTLGLGVICCLIIRTGRKSK
jgi:hypothetical protein